MVSNCGRQTKANAKTKEVKETENNLVARPLLDVVMNSNGEVLALGKEGKLLTASEPGSISEVYRLDLKAKTGQSVSKYGNKIWKIAVSGQNTLLLIGEVLLCCKHTSNSIFPLQKGMSAEAHFVSAGPTLAMINRNKLSILTDIDSNWADFDYDIKDNLVCLTSDGKYAILVEQPKTIKLIRVEDRQELASFSFLVDVSTLQVSSDGIFVVIGGVDGRIYSYVIADPDDETHNERITDLPSRQQPVILQIERRHDPRYKVLRNMTVEMESSSFGGSACGSDEESEGESSTEESDIGSADGNMSEIGSSGEDDKDGSECDSHSASDDGGKDTQESPRSLQKNVRRSSAKQESARPKTVANGKQKKAESVFMPLPNGTVCLAPIPYRKPGLQVGYKNRIQKVSNRFTEVDISNENRTYMSKNSPDVRNIWTAPVSRDPRHASCRLTSLHSRKGTSMSSSRPLSGEDMPGSKTCVIS